MTKRAPDSPPRTILYVHASDELYGSDLTLLQLVRGLDRARYRPVVVLPTDLPYEGLLSAELGKSGVACLKLDLAVVRRRYLTPRGILTFAGRLLRSTAQLLALIRRERVALVHSNTIVVWPGALAAALSRRPHVWQIHELLTGPARLRRLIARVLLVLSTVVVANSQATRAALFGARVDPRRAPVIHNGIELPPPADVVAVSRIRAAWGAGADEVVVGTVGRVSYRKGQRELLQAAEAVMVAEPHARFVIVGGPVPGQEALFEDLRGRAESGAFSGRIVFTGFRRDVADILHAIDIFVLPSLLPEPFGLVIIEAMACSKPIVATRPGGPSEIVVDGETGLLVPSGDQEALADAIRQIVTDADLRERFGREGQARMARDFSLDAYTTKFTALYTGLLPQ